MSDWIQLCAERLLSQKFSPPLSPVSSSELHKDSLGLPTLLAYPCLFSLGIPAEQHCERPLSCGKDVTRWYFYSEKNKGTETAGTCYSLCCCIECLCLTSFPKK